ncbi:two-component response regulator ARR11-like isoform X2 [Trifolium pratense]|uniref:Uncharacterized protein n=1 Tax=Trifolium pratense TaxID=57577 RepID=A0ACB0KKB7_TRIPR|nr:two-component response regulator ARR11-like isoform X2 [Trifolium pratense]CAJ2657679.1 unnamed protein product [Trifolium pratense]
MRKLRKVKFKIKGQSRKPYAATPSVVPPFLLNSGSLLCIILSFNMEFNMPQLAVPRIYTGPVAGVKVLVVDANSACRAVISKSLLSLGYEVATATLASEALSIIGEKKNEINLVLVEAQLPDMEIYELVAKMKSSNIPSFIMTSYDDDILSITQALHIGAKWSFRKPVRISDLQQLWRFAVWNRFERAFCEEVFYYWWPEVVTNGKAQESFDNKDTIVLLKTRRRTWTDDLHRKFLDAVQTAGINAPPKTIFELMDVEGLKKESVRNYLKKYRQSMNLHASPMGQHVNGDVSLTKKSRGKRSLSLGSQGVTDNPAFNQKDLSNFVPASEIISQVVNTADGKVSNAGQQLNFSTLLAFNMSDQFFPALPIALLPIEKNEKIDEVYNAKESQMFTDEDLKMWLSTISDNVTQDAVA